MPHLGGRRRGQYVLRIISLEPWGVGFPGRPVGKTPRIGMNFNAGGKERPGRGAIARKGALGPDLIRAIPVIHPPVVNPRALPVVRAVWPGSACAFSIRPPAPGFSPGAIAVA